MTKKDIIDGSPIISLIFNKFQRAFNIFPHAVTLNNPSYWVFWQASPPQIWLALCATLKSNTGIKKVIFEWFKPYPSLKCWKVWCHVDQRVECLASRAISWKSLLILLSHLSNHLPYSHDHHHDIVIPHLPSALPSAQVTQAAFEDLRDIWRDTFDPGEIFALGVILSIQGRYLLL